MESNSVNLNQQSIEEELAIGVPSEAFGGEIPGSRRDAILSTSSPPILFVPAPKDGGLEETNWGGSFQPVTLRALLDQPQEEVPWVIEGYVAEGRLTILAGPPK